MTPDISQDYNKMFVAKNRLETFDGWRHSGKLSKDSMSQCGFYMLNPGKSNDWVRCAFCQTDIGDWEAGDDPFEEHLKISNNCPMAQLKLPEDELYVAQWYECVLYAGEVQIRRKVQQDKEILKAKLEKLKKCIARLEALP